MSDRLPISVVILTLNEETRLPRCLTSVTGCDDIVILDSGSTDRTQEIARAAGARVIVNPFVNFAEQRNFAHHHAAFRHPWVFHLDADEQMTPELLAEIKQVAAADPPLDGCYAAPRMLLHGHWMRRCTDYPAWQARFVRHQTFSFIQSGHGQREAPGLRMGYLQHGYTHDITFPDPDEWETKHLRYAEEEAREINQHTAPLATMLNQIFSGQGLERRRAAKQLSHLLPARSLLRFCYQYILRGGFLDGAQAWNYCRQLARYEAFTTRALRRLRRQPHE